MTSSATERDSALKQALIRSSNEHKAALAEELEQLVSEAEDLGKGVLWIAGGLVIGYQLLKLFLPEEKRKSKTKGRKNLAPQQVRTLQDKPSPTRLGRLKEQLMEEALLLVLSEVRKKLVVYLEQTQHDEQQENI